VALPSVALPSVALFFFFSLEKKRKKGINETRSQ